MCYHYKYNEAELSISLILITGTPWQQSLSFCSRFWCHILLRILAVILPLIMVHYTFFLKILNNETNPLPNIFLLEWNNGLTAVLDVTSDHDGSGYTLVLTFDQEVTLEQWSGEGSSSDQK